MVRLMLNFMPRRKRITPADQDSGVRGASIELPNF
jgi:hypothetical protein